MVNHFIKLQIESLSECQNALTWNEKCITFTLKTHHHTWWRCRGVLMELALQKSQSKYFSVSLQAKVGWVWVQSFFMYAFDKHLHFWESSIESPSATEIDVAKVGAGITASPTTDSSMRSDISPSLSCWSGDGDSTERLPVGFSNFWKGLK